jgi:hypothetical protein
MYVQPPVYFSWFCHTLNSLIQLRMVSFGSLNNFDRLGDEPWLVLARNPCCDNPASLILLRIPVWKEKAQHSLPGTPHDGLLPLAPK